LGAQTPTLFERYPVLAETPYRPIAQLPTPVIEVPELAEQAGLEAVWIKCDNLTATPYGGNKVRKLEFLLADALSKECSAVWTIGAIGSNHCLATTLYAGRVGLDVRVRHFAQPVSENVLRNCLAVGALGARLTLGRRNTIPFAVLKRRMFPDKGCYDIPAGGSSAVGALGYVNAGLEIADQIDQGHLPEPDAVVAAVGTAGTLVGLLIGFRLAGMETTVVGVRVVDKLVVNNGTIRGLYKRTVALLAERGVKVPGGKRIGAYRLVHSQYGAGYGSPTEAGRSAVAAASASGISLEQTYTGKAMAAVLDPESRPEGAQVILYINTFNSCPVQPLIPEDFGPDRLPPEYARFFGQND
jgi:D-cysteine desulfhydrase